MPTKTKSRTATNRKREYSCACGCGGKTARTFAQGHDAKARSILKKVQRGELTVTAIPAALRTAALTKGSDIARLLRKAGA